MSKTFREIYGGLQIAIGAALEFVPGAQGIATAFIVSGVTVLGTALLQRAPKPQTSVTSIKVATPPRVSAYGRVRLYWAYILYETASDGWAVDVGVFHDGRLDAIEQHYIGDQKVTVLSGGWVQKGPAGEWGNNDSVRVGTRLGLPTETAFSEVIAKLPGIWTSNHRGDGCGTGFMLSKNVKAENFQTIYAAGGPNNATLSIVARAQRVFDWRDPTQNVADPATWKWSENVVLQTVHYHLVRMNKSWDRHFAPTLAYATAAANDADTAMPLKSGGTEPRYRSCVAHKHTDAHKDTLSHLLGCFDGWIAPRADGALVIYSGCFYEPTVTIGPDEILSYSLQEGVDEESAVNTIKTTYVSGPHDYSAVDTDDWTDEDDITARGKQLATTLENQVPSHSQARRLAKREMARIMAAQRGTTTTNAGGRAALGQRYIRQRIVEAGTTFQNAVVEITKLTRNPQTGGLTYEWVLADPNVDAWNPATEEGDPAPVGDRVAREPLAAPSIESAAADYSAVSSGGAGVRIAIDATGPDRDDLTWFARWRMVGSSIWNENAFTDTAPGAAVSLLTGFVPAQAEVEVEVSYRTGDGRVSPWSSPATEVDTATDLVPPDSATAITLTNWSDSIDLTTDLILRASSYRWRVYADDGVTLIRTIITSTPAASYTAAQAEVDIPRRSYVVDVAGVNGAGAGSVATTGVLTNAAPAAVTGTSATGGTSEGQFAFTPSSDPSVAGYVVYVSTASGFDPLTQGSAFYNNGSSPIYLQNLAAGTFYAKIAAFDAWTKRPDLLTFSTEHSFVITTGGGGVGGGGGDGGGGYCPEVSTLILLANSTADGPGEQREAGALRVGDLVWTQHEHTLGWGAWPVTAVEIVEAPVFVADIGVSAMRATAAHLVWLGGGWVRIDALGTPDGHADVARITVADAHTYVANGVLSHNIKDRELV